MRTKLLALLIALSGMQALGASLNSTPVVEPRQIADDAMKLVADDDMKNLFALITKNMPMDRKALDQLRDTSIEQRKKIGPVLGKPMGFAFIKECRVSDFLVRLVYAEKREKNVLRWQFIFYRSRNAWTMVNFTWDENVNALFAPCS